MSKDRTEPLVGTGLPFSSQASSSLAPESPARCSFLLCAEVQAHLDGSGGGHRQPVLSPALPSGLGGRRGHGWPGLAPQRPRCSRIQSNYMALQRINQELEDKLYRMVRAPRRPPQAPPQCAPLGTLVASHQPSCRPLACAGAAHRACFLASTPPKPHLQDQSQPFCNARMGGCSWD